MIAMVRQAFEQHDDNDVDQLPRRYMFGNWIAELSVKRNN